MIWKTTPGSIFAILGLSEVRLGVKSNSTFLIAMLLFASLFHFEETNAQVIPVLKPTGGFNIDGNLVASPLAGDWVPQKKLDGSYNTGAGNFVFYPDGTPVDGITSAIVQDKYNSSLDDVFNGGQKANDNPADWTYQHSAANPQKGDINNAFYHITKHSVTKDDWLFVGSDRLSNNGTSYIDFEFFQHLIYKDPNSNRFIAEGPNQGRTENDLMISLTYEKGGSNVDIQFFLWLDLNGDGIYKYEEQTLSSVDAFATGNDVSIDIPFGAFGSQSYAPYLFAEAGLNMTNIFKTLSQNGICAGVAIKSFLVKTKNSGAPAANINDYIGPIPVKLIFGTAEISYATVAACQASGTIRPEITGIQNGTFSASPEGLEINSNGVIDLAKSATGSYTITYSFESYGCTKSTTTQFNFNPVVAAITGKDDLSCTNTSVTLDASSSTIAGSASYIWNTKATTASIEVTSPGEYTVTVTDMDTGCTDTTTVTIVSLPDTEDPVITTCLDNITVSAKPDFCSIDATDITLGTPIGTDNCDSDLTFTNNAPSSFPVGNTDVIWTATDDAGNTTSCTQVVTVTDNQAPTITCSAAVNQSADAGACETFVTVIAPVTSDNCGIDTIINDYNDTADASGTYPVGTTTVTWTVTDIHGNTNTCTQDITVTDDQLPVITAGDNITTNADAGTCGAAVTVTPATATDNCAVAAPVRNDNAGFDPAYPLGTRDDGLALDAPYPVGTTIITWTAKDIHGNAADAVQQTVTVIDNIAPVKPTLADITVGQCEGTPVTPTTTDNCAGTITGTTSTSFPLTTQG
ncbi:MAG: HYR domain-containing protein, partial [Salinimicrobium sp.]